jgi:predicted DNA-binding transcriptional regulator AlpA
MSLEHSPAKQRRGGIGHNGGPPLSPEDLLRVLTVGEFAKLNGLSTATVKRMVQRGTGPRVIRLSIKRIGIKLVDALQWQAERVQS